MLAISDRRRFHLRALGMRRDKFRPDNPPPHRPVQTVNKISACLRGCEQPGGRQLFEMVERLRVNCRLLGNAAAADFVSRPDASRAPSAWDPPAPG